MQRLITGAVARNGCSGPCAVTSAVARSARRAPRATLSARRPAAPAPLQHRRPVPPAARREAVRHGMTKVAGTKRSRRLTVGVAGFEPTASSSRTKRATKLRHTPVPFEYSLTPSIFPNGDGVSARSVVHAAYCLAVWSRKKPGGRWWRLPPTRGARATEKPRGALRCESLRKGRSPGQPRRAATPQRRPEPPTASSPSRMGAKYRSS